jgi:histidine triad (HIT) family protein
MTDSLFTQIIQRKIPASIVYEDELFIAFKDIHPKAPVHVLVVTKEPFESLEHIPTENEELHAKILLIARKVAGQLGIAQNYKIALNVGLQVQAIQHLHVHLMGGWQNLKSPGDAEVGI